MSLMMIFESESHHPLSSSLVLYTLLKDVKQNLVSSRLIVELDFQGLRGDPGVPGLPGAQGFAGLPVWTTFKCVVIHSTFRDKSLVSYLCCLPSGDTWVSWLTRRQGESAGLRSCDLHLTWTPDDSVFLFQGQEGPSPVIPGPQGQKVRRLTATVAMIQISCFFLLLF